MSQSLVLHIGTEKTGTSSIQAFLKANRESLASKGFYVPDFLATPEGNHRWLPFMFYLPEQIDDWILLQELQDKEVRQSRLNTVATQIETHINRTPKMTWIVSSEHLQSRLLNSSQVDQLNEFLKVYFKKIKVIIYLRDPISTAISFWSTAVRTGSSIFSLPGPGSIANYNCAHKSILERWSSVFGKENLVVRLFTRKQLLNNDLIFDFAYHAEVPWDDSFIIPGIRNKTLSYKAIKILSCVNKSIPFSIHGRINQERGNLHTFFDAPFDSYPRYIPTATEIEDYNIFYWQDSEWVKQVFFSDMTSLWNYELLTCREENDFRFCSSLADDEIALSQCIVNIWLSKQKQIFRLRDALGKRGMSAL